MYTLFSYVTNKHLLSELKLLNNQANTVGEKTKPLITLLRGKSTHLHSIFNLQSNLGKHVHLDSQDILLRSKPQ